jgi:hypothetical protein
MKSKVKVGVKLHKMIEKIKHELFELNREVDKLILREHDLPIPKYNYPYSGIEIGDAASNIRLEYRRAKYDRKEARRKAAEGTVSPS